MRNVDFSRRVTERVVLPWDTQPRWPWSASATLVVGVAVFLLGVVLGQLV